MICVTVRVKENRYDYGRSQRTAKPGRGRLKESRWLTWMAVLYRGSGPASETTPFLRTYPESHPLMATKDSSLSHWGADKVKEFAESTTKLFPLSASSCLWRN